MTAEPTEDLFTWAATRKPTEGEDQKPGLETSAQKTTPLLTNDTEEDEAPTNRTPWWLRGQYA